MTEGLYHAEQDQTLNQPKTHISLEIVELESDHGDIMYFMLLLQAALEQILLPRPGGPLDALPDLTPAYHLCRRSSKGLAAIGIFDIWR